MINIGQRLPEIGRIKIGGNRWIDSKRYPGEKQKIPEKWDWFKLTTTEKDDKDNWIIDNAMTKAVAHPKEKNPLQPIRIGPCYLPLDSIDGNFHTTFGYYTKSSSVCTSQDGITARRLNNEDLYEECACDPINCPDLKDKNCKPSGILSIIFEKAPKFGGVYVFRTHSWNSVRAILSQMILYYSQTERMFGYGRLSGIPFYLTLNKTRQKNSEGKMHDIRYVSLEYDGDYNAFCDFCTTKLQLPEVVRRPSLNPTTQSLLDQKALTARAASIVQDPEEWDGAEEADAEVVEPESSLPEPEEPKGPVAQEHKKQTSEPESAEKGKKAKRPPKKVKCPTCKNMVTKLVERDGGRWCVDCNAKHLLEPTLNTEPISIEVMTNTKKYKWNVKQPVAVAFMQELNSIIKTAGRKAVNESLAPHGVTIESLNEISEEDLLDIVAKIENSKKGKEKTDDKPEPEKSDEVPQEPPVESDQKDEGEGVELPDRSAEGGGDTSVVADADADGRTESEADKDAQLRTILIREILTQCVINAKIDFEEIPKVELEIECIDFVRRVTGIEMKKFDKKCLNDLTTDALCRVEARVHKEIKDKKEKEQAGEQAELEEQPQVESQEDKPGLW